jgi:HEAT repeat protein
MMLSLAGAEASGAVPSLLGVLKDDPVPDVRAFAALALADIAPAAASVRSGLERALGGDSGGAVRASAAAALGKVASPASVDPLVAALRDSDSRTRLEAVRALASIHDDGVKRALPSLEELSKDTDSTIASEARALATKLRKQ